MPEPARPVPVHSENAACVLPGVDDEHRQLGDHASDVIVIILVVTVVSGHWSPEQVLGLIAMILAALGVKAFKQA